jgi:hypothetical protein
LRQAQAIVLPLDYGLSLEQTARAIGCSVTWTCRLRNRFLAGEIAGDGQRHPRPQTTGWLTFTSALASKMAQLSVGVNSR